jgi:MFS transporter, DHA2 family, multidrug resistance protein
MIYGLKQIAEHGVELAPAAFILAGLVAGTVFIYRQLHLTTPLIDLGLFRMPAFTTSLATYLLGGVVMFGAFVFISQYLQLVLGLSPLEAGLWTMPFALAFVVGSMLTPALSNLCRPAYLMAAGPGVGALGFVMMSQVDAQTGLWLLVPSSIVFSLGLAPVFTLTTDVVIGTAPPEKAGAASAISETCGEFGGALGIALLGSLGAAIYRSEMSGSIPEGVPPESEEASQSTLGGAVSAAGELPAAIGDQLLAVARDAFSQSFEVVSVVSALLLALAAVIVGLRLRNVIPTP